MIKLLDIAKTITTIRVRLPHKNKIIERTMLLTQAHKSIEVLFEREFWKLDAGEADENPKKSKNQI